MHWLGRCYVLDMRLDQEYLRSQPVNSEEGAPMGIGIWYEMFISDPVAYLFKNADPRGSLAANVSNSTVRCLSNMKLAGHAGEPPRHEPDGAGGSIAQIARMGLQAGFGLHSQGAFPRCGMIKQIEEKVVNRLRQVTSAIKQDGVNQVSIITSTAERQAAVEFAKAAAIRPQIVGEGLRRFPPTRGRSAMFDILETQRITHSHARIVLMPENPSLVAQLIGAESDRPDAPPDLPTSRRGKERYQAGQAPDAGEKRGP